ncbi:hypothetical protein LMG28138_05663 [Pararobbsia alpina]|uniref:DNA helicase n=1 Tax=Pararobbsia alpina TaxID=621374 RepID=A0A6S7DGI3_9BURK|nr:hypothetical protein LMG28138_05663 [Pararobbsia alpina]
MPAQFRPTPEQQAIVDAAGSGDNLKIKAYAGAGKTSTLRLVAHRLAPQRGTYLAFNREIAEHARRGFPDNVVARTVHSLAYAATPSALTSRVSLPAEPPHELAGRYGLSSVEVPSVTGKALELTPFDLGRMVADGLGRFCRSASPVPEPAHIPVDDKINTGAAEWLRGGLLPSGAPTARCRRAVRVPARL